MVRAIDRRYDDPLDTLWVAAAARLGVRVERTAEAYATYDGRGTLRVAAPEHLDPDDCLAQMIFHELCHALVAGADATRRADWGLSNADDRDLAQEHACHRLQAHLADRHGLRAFFAVTTDHRPHWDALPADPLTPGDHADVVLARAALERARTTSWFEVLDDALRRTADLAEAVRGAAPPGSLWADVKQRHATGFVLGAVDRTCGECAWSRSRSARASALTCRQAEVERRGTTRVRAADRACVRWERRLGPDDCRACGACCREGFDVTPVSPREPIVELRPDLIRREGRRRHLLRPGGRCVALAGGAAGAPFTCTVYEARPRACRDLEIGGAACLEARRRAGVSA